ncbi:hypothetical protein CLI64_04450 [Nostoc sp. CENA543]|uniref:hypothetical protein n=1 Tax=Nostoc sp. CENA543 TaxID=1869241 RepID=UPI000CA187CD|nr:hypothetical protein [Nostoc sp. CENA543]AUS99699.1 hypothetical protein CLI64_04450 [Nostoc sp. CENA543]
MANNISNQGRTSAPAYLMDTPGSPKYAVIPLLTVGDEVPLLTSTFSSTTAPTVDSSQLFAFTGTPNATGTTQVKIDGKTYHYVWVNHGLAGDVTTNISTTATNKTIIGGRVSLYVFDQDWKVVGGKNLVESITDSTGTYTLDTATGLYTNSQGSSLADIDSFASAYLATSGFVDSNGQEVPLLFEPNWSLD